MRRIVMFNRVSADGIFAAPDGNLDWTVPDAELDRVAAQSIDRGEGDTFLFGRRTYEMFASFWPHVLSGAAAEGAPQHAGEFSPEMLAMARVLDASTKIVFSRTLGEPTWRNTRRVRDLDPARIEAMKREPGKDMMIFGSGSIVRALTEHGLIDEYQFVVSPVVLGEGKRLTEGLESMRRLRLLEARTFESGNLMLRYAPA